MKLRPSAFTVIELLLVVGIVSVLLVLSLSAFGRLRGHTDNVKCINNLQGLGRAILLYTQDHDGRFPPSVESNYPGPIFGTQVPSWGPTWGEYIVRNYLNGDKSFLRCPARPQQWGNAAGYYLDYVYNERFSPLDSATGLYVGMRVSAVQNPAQKILLADGGRPSGSGFVGGYYATKDAYRLFPRHTGSRLMVLYLDLHVETHVFNQNGILPPVTHPLGRNSFDPLF